MIEIVKYRAEHGTDITRNRMRPVEKWNEGRDDLDERAKEKETPDAWTMLKDDKAIACGGFYKCAGDTADAWFLISIDARPHVKLLVRIVKNIITKFMEDNAITRLNAYVQADDKAGHRWAECMDFHRTEQVHGHNGKQYVAYERTA